MTVWICRVDEMSFKHPCVLRYNVKQEKLTKIAISEEVIILGHMSVIINIDSSDCYNFEQRLPECFWNGFVCSWIFAE